jgi:hypothetical protein
VDQFFPRGKLVVLRALVPVLGMVIISRLTIHSNFSWNLRYSVRDSSRSPTKSTCGLVMGICSSLLLILTSCRRPCRFRCLERKLFTSIRLEPEFSSRLRAEKLLVMDDTYHSITNTFKGRRNFKKMEHSDIISIHGSLKYKYIQLPRSLQRKRVRGWDHWGSVFKMSTVMIQEVKANSVLFGAI